jgi:hypothetical protein
MVLTLAHVDQSLDASLNVALVNRGVEQRKDVSLFLGSLLDLFKSSSVSSNKVEKTELGEILALLVTYFNNLQ